MNNMKTKTKKSKTVDPAEALYYKYFNNKPVNLMAIPQIHRDITQLIQENALIANTTVGEANLDQGMQDLVTKYHKPY